MVKYKSYTRKKLKDIPKFDRPREKMIERGAGSLSNLELIAVIVGNGIKGRDVFEVAREITDIAENDFENLSLEKLRDIDGIGNTKACQILASIEFSRRFLVGVGIPIRNESDVLPLVEELRDRKQEYFITLTLDGAHRLIERRTVFIGTLTQTLVHPREVFADALSDRAAAIIFVHNHPDEQDFPSKEDILVTNRLISIAEIMGIEVLDHIILTRTKSFSFKNKGMLDNR